MSSSDVTLVVENDPPCTRCMHYTGAATCVAFPDGIPRSVLSGEDPHEKAIDGDDGFRFKPLTDAPNYGEIE